VPVYHAGDLAVARGCGGSTNRVDELVTQIQQRCVFVDRLVSKHNHRKAIIQKHAIECRVGIGFTVVSDENMANLGAAHPAHGIVRRPTLSAGH
jgi:hypothetical protein